jgi:Tfp pilus assembly pilus retraction ATPase PilT
MDAGSIVLVVIVAIVGGFLINNFVKARRMNLAELLAFAIQVKATEVKLEVGKPILLVTPEGIRTVFGPKLKMADYETWMLQRLDAFRRQQLGATGRCEWQFEEEGIGKIGAEIEPSRARLTLLRSGNDV